MLENRPILRERLLAAAAFGGIAVGAIAALDLMVTGGFDFAPSARAERQAISAVYTSSAQPFEDVAGVTPTSASWAADMPMETSEPAEDLAGDDNAVMQTADYAPQEFELYDQIAALYADEPAEEEPVYADDKSEFSVY